VLRAPGREVLTLTPGGHYDFVSGSSLAAAHVSGAAALLLAENPRLDGSAVYSLLSRASADSSINVCAALALLRPDGACAGPAAPVLSDLRPDPRANPPR
jgi:subtilisin family serine protease